MDAYFRGHAGLTVVIARQLSPVRGLAALSAGGTRVPWRRFFAFNAPACAVWSTAVTLLATLFVRHLDAVADDISLAGTIVVGAGLAVAGVLLWRLARRRLRLRRRDAGALPSHDAPATGSPPAHRAASSRHDDGPGAAPPLDDLAATSRRDDDLAAVCRRDDDRRSSG